ncbi:MAG: 1,4-alpha-glucan branching protein GlgB [Pseudomonadota bacterium]
MGERVESKAEQKLTVSPDIVTAICGGLYDDPFSVLGMHEVGGLFVARAYLPGAEQVEVETLTGERCGSLEGSHPSGFFEGPVSLSERQPLVFQAKNANDRWRVIDPYSFGPVLGPMDDYLIAEGSHKRLFDKFGAHLIEHEGARGVHFSVWAPNARRVSVVGSFNQWDGRRHVMRRRSDIGSWEIFIPELNAGEVYKYEIVASDGTRQPLKADPFAFESELRPRTASKIAPTLDHQWQDEDHRKHWRETEARRQPISIYEVHAGSWKLREDGSFLSWDELADELIPYVVDIGFTHIEFLPVTEHPYDPSWGYQTTGLYAPSARFGDAAGFARFVDGAHMAGVGVILDWVPAHFPTDEHGLARFDGTALYEHEDPRQGYHPDWNTLIYNFGRREVASYLVNNALYWAEKFHLDGLRVDAVASMLYLDYSREEGEWIPNKDGGRENLEAVAFLQEVNKAVHAANPGILMMAEESTSWPGVSKPVHEGGLGFGFKWNMGFMHDTLQFLSRDPIHRQFHHNEITFGLLYAFAESFVLPLSHDEVVHGKGSLLNKMAGDDAQKFATLRAYFAMMWAYPGKKLLFMGQEFAQRNEWSEARALDWGELDHAPHSGVQALVRELNQLYRSRSALHARDCEGDGFEWLIADDKDNSVFAWRRKAPDTPDIVLVTNLTPAQRSHYRVPVRQEGRWRLILKSDEPQFGGCGSVWQDAGIHTQDHNREPALELELPPLTSMMFEYDGSG